VNREKATEVNTFSAIARWNTRRCVEFVEAVCVLESLGCGFDQALNCIKDSDCSLLVKEKGHGLKYEYAAAAEEDRSGTKRSARNDRLVLLQ